MTAWQAVYTHEQRAAIEHAYCIARIRPATRIPRLAEAGELPLDGTPLPAFKLPYATAITIGKNAEKRRAGDVDSMDKLHPRDQAERLRRRLVNLADWELKRLERRSKQGRTPVDAGDLTKLARLLRELATIPAPDEKRLPKSDPHKERHEPTSLAGAILGTAARIGAAQPPNQPERINTDEDQERGSSSSVTAEFLEDPLVPLSVLDSQPV